MSNWRMIHSGDFSDAIASVDFHRLPHGFHRYFESDGQTPGHAYA
jgi:hypothetical protein